MDLNIIKVLQTLRSPVVDWFFYIVTQFGDQYAFIVMAVILYWTYDKIYAHKFATTFMISALINTGIKEIVKRDRPYIKHPTEVETETKWLTDGYSFPSGHSQSIGVLGYTLIDLHKKHNKKFLYWIAIFLMIFVPISRLYLAQHFPSDVIVGLGLSILMSYLLFKMLDRANNKEEFYTLALIPVFAGLMFFIKTSSLYLASGAFIGFAIGYYLEKRYIKYNVKNTLGKQILKIIIGLVIALAFKEGLKHVFPSNLLFTFIRYFIIGVWVALGAPWVFKYVFKSN